MGLGRCTYTCTWSSNWRCQKILITTYLAMTLSLISGTRVDAIASEPENAHEVSTPSLYQLHLPVIHICTQPRPQLQQHDLNSSTTDNNVNKTQSQRRSPNSSKQPISELSSQPATTSVDEVKNKDKSQGGIKLHQILDQGSGVGVGQDYFEVPKYLIREQLRESNGSIKFRLASREISCPNGHFQLILPISPTTASASAPVVAAASTQSQPSIPESEPPSNNGYFYYNVLQPEDAQMVYFSPDGYLTMDSVHYHPNEYCIQSQPLLSPSLTNGTQNSSSILVNVCHPNCSTITPCLSKCCDLNEYWDDEIDRCVVIPAAGESNGDGVTPPEESAAAVLWGPQFYTPSERDCLDNFTLEFVHYKTAMPNCSDGNLPLIYYQSDHHFRLLGNGTVTGRIPPADWKPLSNTGFCIDKSLRYGSDSELIFDQIILACPRQVNTMRVKDSIAPLYLFILFTAAFILLFTAIIYLILWKSQNLHGWCIFCEVVSMFAMIMFVSIAHSLARDPDNGDYGSFHCVVIGALSHFFFLSTFFWLTVINADLWWNFRKLSPVNKSPHQAHNYRRFFLYLFISEGGPAAIVVIGLLLDEAYGLKSGGLDCAEIVVPNYGYTNCYLSKTSQGPYLFYPIGILLGFNFAFFSLTLISMLKYRKGTQEILRGKSTNQTQSVTLVAKLFIVMGVSWVFEIVAWALNQRKQKNAGYVPPYWIVFDFVSLVQAFAIFVIFICRRSVTLQLRSKFPCLQKLWNLFPSTNDNRRPSGNAFGASSRRATNFSTRTSQYTISNSPSTTEDFRMARIQSRTNSTPSGSVVT